MASAAQNAPALAHFIRSRRWFRSKTRDIQQALIEDVIPVSNRARILIVKLEYSEGDCDYYVLTDSGASSSEPVEALDDADLRGELLNAFLAGRSYRGQSGELIFSRTSALHGSVDARKLPSTVSRAEQSNTSIIYGDQFILKLFRKIESGVNPDVEIGAFLTQHGFKHTPAVLGTLEYRLLGNQVYSAGILQEFVQNKGDAWKYTLESLSSFFERVNSLSPDENGEQWGQLAGDYLKSAALLGQRTAEMHIALSRGSGNPDFEPERFTPEASHELYDQLISQADIAFRTLRQKQSELAGEAASLAQKLLELEARVTDRFAELRDSNVTASRIRIHGDYHLGQVLWTGSDFMIIDFEGEPARPLSERRANSFAMRDVAGMLRSFQYAAYAALFDLESAAKTLERWADLWTGWISDAYLNAYLHSASDNVFLPADEHERRLLLDAFLLHKALYEVAYEMNNRPDWVRIPLKGILGLVA